MQRRDFLKGGAVVAGGGLVLEACAGRPRTDQGVTLRTPPTDVETMAKKVLETPRDDVPQLALDWVKRGATFRDLLGAAYLAGLHEVNPSPIGGQVHAMMMVASASETAVLLRGRDKLLPALFNLDRLKRSQERDAGSDRGDWSMPPPPEVEARPAADLAASLGEAMLAWDEAAADRAIVGLHDALSLHDFFEVLWPWAARDFRIIGHKIIYATQTYRALQDLGWRRGRDAVRSLGFGVLDQNPYGQFSGDDSKRILGLYDSNLRRAERFPEGWMAGREDPAASAALLVRLRDSDADEAAEAVVAALRDGTAARSVWDGLRLYAFEITMRHPSIAGVHTVTSVNALHRASMYTSTDATRRIMVLQAASWLPLFAAFLASRADLPTEDRAIDALRPASGARDADPFSAGSREESASRAVSMLESGDVAGFSRRALEVLSRKADNDHDYKYSVAAVEEIAAAHPGCRPQLAGASLFYLRTERSTDGSVYRAVRSRLAERK